MSATENLDQTKPQHQTVWDWRAASNFMFGGAGSGLLLFGALASDTGSTYRPYGIVALCLIALGLCCVSLEIGRPLRSMNVFKHVHTSWMTRESLVAPFLFACGALAVWSGDASWIWLAALCGMLFLYCQARMLNASKGIPAWRQQRVLPLMIVTGLTEGGGLLALISALISAPPAWLMVTLMLALAARYLLWRGYRQQLADRAAPPQTLAALDAVESPFIKVGHWLAALILLPTLIPSVLAASAWCYGIAGFLVVTSGWLFKYTLVARAGYNQGYALPRIPVRGRAPNLAAKET